MEPQALRDLVAFYQQRLSDVQLELGQAVVANTALARQLEEARAAAATGPEDQPAPAE